MVSPHFVRQKPLGPYIADFYCPTAKLVIELDGGQHYTEEGQERDAWRSGFLAEMGSVCCAFPTWKSITTFKASVKKSFKS